MSYYMELSFNNREQWFEVPILPQSIEISDGGNGTEYDVYGLGIVNAIEKPKLTTFSFSSLFPGQAYPFVTAKSLLSPIEYVEYLRDWMETKRPIRFILTSAYYDINTPASIDSFEWKESGGAPGDIQYTLKLKQYRFYAARRLDIERTEDGRIASLKSQPPRLDDRAPLKIYTVQPDDNLWKISKKVFGTDTRMRDIQTYNGLTDAQVKQLKPGTVLRIPMESGDAIA